MHSIEEFIIHVIFFPIFIGCLHFTLFLIAGQNHPPQDVTLKWTTWLVCVQCIAEIFTFLTQTTDCTGSATTHDICKGTDYCSNHERYHIVESSAPYKDLGAGSLMGYTI